MLEGIWPKASLQGQALTSTAAQLHSTSAVLNLSLSAARPPTVSLPATSTIFSAAPADTHPDHQLLFTGHH